MSDDATITVMGRRLAVLDAETTQIRAGEIPETLFWGLFDGRTYRKFKSTALLCNYLAHCDHLTMLHHSNFDILQMLVDGAEIDFRKTHNGKIIVSRLGDHLLLNSYAVFPIALADIFEAFGYHKSSLDELEKRNYEDCVNGYDCFVKMDGIFQDIAGVSPLQKNTIAAASFAAAEKVAGKLPKNLSFEQAYRGGRVEAFKVFPRLVAEAEQTELLAARFGSVANKYDINSSYPFSFLDAPREDRLICARVQTSDYYCPFYDAKERERLIFPNGEFVTWFYESNFHKYIEPYASRTKIVKVKHAVRVDFSWFENVRCLIRDVFALKSQTPHKGTRLVCKLFLNSMYGRIGLRGEREQARFVDRLPIKPEVLHYYIGGRFLVFYTSYTEPRSNFSFAAFITDNARARLYKSFCQNNAWYGDTDSVVVAQDQTSYREPLGTGCGQWKFEGREKFLCFTVKDYIFGDDQVNKGGHEFLSWTLKRMASGDGAQNIVRVRKTTLQKRHVRADGVTVPLKVCY